MQPARALSNSRDDFENRIERAGIDIAGLRANQNWSVNARQNSTKLIWSHAALIVRRNSDDLLASQTKHLQASKDRYMRFIAGYDRDSRRANQTLLLNAPPEFLVQRMSSAGETGKVSHRAAGNKSNACSFGETE